MQKFKNGDLVQIAKDLGQSMKHFTAGCKAIVIGSYNDEYGRGSIKDYSLYIENRGLAAWYDESQLTLIEENRLDILEEWKSIDKKEREMKGDIDWIFSHGKEVLDNPHGASISTLAR